MKHLIAVGFILFVASVAWCVLGGTLVLRTQSSDDAQRAALSGLWGSAQDQHAAQFTETIPIRKRELHNGKWIDVGPGTDSVDAAPESTTIAVGLDLDRRQKGLLWYDTYAVDFAGTYRVHMVDRATRLCISLPFAARGATYTDVVVQSNGRAVPFSSDGSSLLATIPVVPGTTQSVRVGYRSHGLDTWRYTFGEDVADVRDFSLTMRTNFPNVDFPPGTLSPTQERDAEDGKVLTWRFGDLVAGNGIGMDFPEPMQPGPLAQRITLWAPLALGFYFFVMLIYTTLRKIDLHPMNYFFLAGAFFAFHLLFAYTVDRIPLVAAFTIASVVSMFLTISYLRLVVGLRFAAVEAALAQFFYLILFSLALFDEGFSGLSITIGAIVTLFVTMQWTAKVDWSDVLVRKRPAPLSS